MGNDDKTVQKYNLNESNGEYYFKNDNDCLMKYDKFVNNEKHNEEYKSNYKIHLEVLPQPFFGNIDNPEILVLAKNPSYDEFGDEFDTKMYLEKRNDYENYIDDLKKVNLSKKIDVNKFIEVVKSDHLDIADDNINYLFFNAWKWWKENVFCQIELNEKLCCLNLHGYHSRYYNEVNDNKNINIECLKQLLESFKNVKQIFVVWGDSLWEKVINDCINDDLKKAFNNRKVLNKGIHITPIGCNNSCCIIKDINQKEG